MKSVNEINTELCNALGVGTTLVSKVVLTIHGGELPTIEVSKHVIDTQEIKEVLQKYQLVSVGQPCHEMDRDEIIRIAREAGFRSGYITLYSCEPLPFVAPVSATDCLVELQRFAELVAAAEREACAKVCEAQNETGAHKRCAAAIRARTQPPKN